MFCTYFLKRCFSILFNTFSNMCYFYEGEKKERNMTQTIAKTNKQLMIIIIMIPPKFYKKTTKLIVSNDTSQQWLIIKHIDYDTNMFIEILYSIYFSTSKMS